MVFVINTDRPFLVNSEIIEWDIKSANVSIIEEYGLLDSDKIEKIKKMNKKQRVIYVGKEMRSDKVFSKELERSFDKVVKEFIELNNLDMNYDIVSIKRDAVYVVNREINNSKLGDFINFMPKNKYIAYLYLKPYEFYIKPNYEIDIKGLNDSYIPLHEKGILSFIRDIIKIASNSNLDYEVINKYLSDFVNAYKNRELEFDFYREFNAYSLYNYQNYGNQMFMEEIDENILESINIDYNYINIILPLIQTILH